MLFINFLCLLYLMVLINGHTISKSIDNDEKLDDIFDSVTDLDHTRHPKLRRDRFLHKYRTDFKDEYVRPTEGLREPRVFAETEKTTEKTTTKPTSEHTKHHKSPKRRVGSFWRKFRGKDKKNKHNDAKERKRRIPKNREYTWRLPTTKEVRSTHPKNKSKRKNKKQFVLRRPEINYEKRDVAETVLFSSREHKKLGNKLQIGITPHIDQTKRPNVKVEAMKTSDTNMNHILQSMTTQITHLKRLYGLDKYNPGSYSISPIFGKMLDEKLTTRSRTTTTRTTIAHKIEHEYADTAQIEELLNDIKVKAIQMVAEQSPAITDIITNTVTEATFEADPILNHVDLASPGYLVSTYVSLHHIDTNFYGKRTVAPTSLNEFYFNDSVVIANTEPHYLVARSIKEDTMTMAQNVEDLLQRKLKKIYHKVKNKVSDDFRKEVHKAKSTIKEGVSKAKYKITTKAVTTSNKPCKSKGPRKNTTSKVTETTETSTKTPILTTAQRRNRGESKRNDKNTPETTRPTSVTYDDYMMLTLYEQMLEKTHEDNVMKLLTSAETPVKKRRHHLRLSKRNPETLTDVKLKEDIQKIYDDTANMPDYDYVEPSSNVPETIPDAEDNNEPTGMMSSEPMRSGTLRVGPINFGPIHFGHINPGPVNTGPMNSGQMNTGQINTGQINTGQMSPGPLSAGPMSPEPTGSEPINSGMMNPESMGSETHDDDTPPTITPTSLDDTSYEGLSNKISYNDFVNGYRHYLKFQKEQGSQNFSNLVKYQAHKHHNVEDIGKFILNKIPPLPTRQKRFFDDSDIEDQELSTKSDDSWFKKHFYLFIDNGPPKKFHTSQTVSLKSAVTEPDMKMLLTTESSIAKPGPREQVFIKIGSDDIDTTMRARDTADMSLEDLSRVLDSIKYKQESNSFYRGLSPTPKESDVVSLIANVTDTASLKINPQGFISKLFGAKRRRTPKRTQRESALPEYDMLALFTEAPKIFGKRCKRTVTKDDTENSVIDDFLSKDIEEKPSTKEALSELEVRNTKETNKYGYVDIDLVPRQTAVVKLRENSPKKSRLKDFFKKFRFKKHKGKNHAKRQCMHTYIAYTRRRARFNPIKKLKDMFKVKTDDRPPTHGFKEGFRVNSIPDYEVMTSHIDTFKPMKYDKPLSIDEMKKQIPNISDVVSLDAESTRRTTKHTSFMYKLDESDRDLLSQYISAKSTKHFTPQVLAKQLSSSIPTQTTKPTTAKFVSLKYPPSNVITVNVKTMSPSRLTTVSRKASQTTALMTLADMNLMLSSIQYKLTKTPRNFHLHSTPYYKRAHDAPASFTKNLFEDQMRRPLEKLTIKSKLTRIAEFPISKGHFKNWHNDIEHMCEANDYMSFHEGPPVENRNKHEVRDISTFTEKKKPKSAQTKSHNLKSNKKPSNVMSNLQSEKPNRYTDYFNDLLMWHNDILNLDKVPSPIWKNILKNIEVESGESYTTPSMSNLMKELDEMNEFLDDGMETRLTRYTAKQNATTVNATKKLNDFSARSLPMINPPNNNNQGLIRSVAMDDRAIVTSKDILIKGEAKYFQYNRPTVTDARLESNQFLTKFKHAENKQDRNNILSTKGLGNKDARRDSNSNVNTNEPAIQVDTTLLAYDDDADSITRGIEVKKLSRNSQKATKLANKIPQHLPLLKTNKAPVQYYNTPLPMKSHEFNKFLKDHQMDVESVTSPIVELPSFMDTWAPKPPKSQTESSSLDNLKPETSQDTKTPSDTTLQTKKIELTTQKLNKINDRKYRQSIATRLPKFTKRLVMKPRPLVSRNISKNRPKVTNDFDRQKRLRVLDDFERQKRFSELSKHPCGFVTKKSCRTTQELNYYNMLKKKMKLFDKKETGSLDKITTQIFTLDPHNKEVEITIINFDDIDKMTTTYKSYDTFTLPPFRRDDTSVFNIFTEQYSPNTSETSTKSFADEMKETSSTDSIHNELLYKDIFKEHTTSTTTQFPPIDFNKNTEYTEDISTEPTTAFTTFTHKLRNPFDFLNKFPHVKNMNVPQRVHISSHHYKYDIFYNEDKKTAKAPTGGGIRPKLSVNTATPPRLFRQIKYTARRTPTTIFRKRERSTEALKIIDKVGKKYRQARDVNTAKTDSEGQYASLVYDLKHLRPTSIAHGKDRHRRLFKISAMIQDKFKSLMRNTTTTKVTNSSRSSSSSASTSSSSSSTRRVPKANSCKCNCSCKNANETTTEADPEREDLKGEGFKVTCITDLSCPHSTTMAWIPTTTPTTTTTTEPTTTIDYMTTTRRTHKTTTEYAMSITPGTYETTTPNPSSHKCKGPIVHELPNDTFYMEPDTYDDQAYYESGPMKQPPAKCPVKPQELTVKEHLDIKRRDVQTQNTFTAKDVAALEVIVDLMKNTLSYEEKDIASVFNNMVQAHATKSVPHNDSTNSIQVHIAIPFDLQNGKKRSPLDPVRVRKVFSAKMSTPVDLEYQVHSFEGTLGNTAVSTSISSTPSSTVSNIYSSTTTSSTIEDGLSPGMYLLVDKPRNGYALKPVKAKIDWSDIKTGRLTDRQAGTTASMTEPKPTETRDMETTSLKNLAKVTLSKDFIAAVNKQLIELYENITRDKESNLQDKESNLREKESNLRDREINLRDKEPNFKDKEPNLVDKGTNLKDKEPNLLDKGTNLKDKELNLLDKVTNLQEKDLNLPGKDLKRQIRNTRSIWDSLKILEEDEEETGITRCVDRYVSRIRIDWEAVKKYFGHDRVCNCKCKPNKAMCRACAASDAVIDELIFEFDNLGRYMKDHCTEIQTFFWMNPSGGQKLRDSVSRIDKSLGDYYKRVKGKCQGRTCETFTTYIDKRQILKITKVPKTDVVSHLINDLSAIAEDLNKTISLKACFNDKLKEEGEKFLHAINNCISNKYFNKRSNLNSTKRKLVKNVYSLDNINVNIICHPEAISSTTDFDPSTVQTSHSENSSPKLGDQLFDYEIENVKHKKRKGFKKLFPRKNRKDKLFTYFVAGLTKLPKSKLQFKRDLDNQVPTPLISDGGGAFWFDYLKGNTNEPRIVRETTKENPKFDIAVVQPAVATKVTPKELTIDPSAMRKNLPTVNTIYMTVKTKPKRVIQRDTDTTTTDYLSYNINQLLQLFGSLQDIEAMNMHSNRSTMFLTRTTTSKAKTKKAKTKKPTKFVKKGKFKSHHKDTKKHKLNQAVNVTTTPMTPDTTNPVHAMTSKITGKSTTNSTSTMIPPGADSLRNPNTVVATKDESITTPKTTTKLTVSVSNDTRSNILTTELKNITSLLVNDTIRTTPDPTQDTTEETIFQSTEFTQQKEGKASLSSLIKTSTESGFLGRLKTATLKFFDNMGQLDDPDSSTPTIIPKEEHTTSSRFVEKVGDTSQMVEVEMDESSQMTTHMSPTIVIINEYDNQIGSDIMNDSSKGADGYKNLLLSIIQYETNRLNDEWHKIAYGNAGKDEGDIKRSIMEIGQSSTPTYKERNINDDYAELESLKNADLADTKEFSKKPTGILNKLVSKIGMKVISGSRKKAVKKPNLREVTKKSKKPKNKKRKESKRKSTTLSVAEACDTRRTSKASEICDIQSTYDKILDVHKTLLPKDFENLVKNISCYKYKRIERSFFIPYKSQGKRWDWIRNKRSLKIHFTRSKGNDNDELEYVNFGDNYDDLFEKYVKGDNGIYKIIKRKKRTPVLRALEIGLRNISPLMPGENEIFAMAGDSVTFDCLPHIAMPKSGKEYNWKTDRQSMLEQDNVEISGVKLTIKNVEPRNVGSYVCSQDNVVQRNVKLSVMSIPMFDVVFLPVYKTTRECSYEDLKAIQRLSASMTKEANCGNVCNIRIDEPVCQRDRGTNSSLIRTTAVLSMNPRRVNCSVQCRRDLASSLVMLCASNTPALSSIEVVMSKDGVNDTLKPYKNVIRPIVTHGLKKKDSNGHHEYHNLVSLLTPGKVDVVLVCPAGYYLMQDQKICGSCPANTSSSVGDNTCTSCPRGTRAGPGAAKCTHAGTQPRRYDWWWYPPCGYMVAICGLACGCGVCVALAMLVHFVSRDPNAEDTSYYDDQCKRNKMAKQSQSSVMPYTHSSRTHPLSPSRVILARFLKPSLTSSRATDSQETKFELWKERNIPPPLPPIDFDF